MNHAPATDCADLDTASASTSADPNINSEPPTLEVMKAVQWLKNGKATDCDGICPELLTCAVGPISSCLYELFLRVGALGHDPAEWREGIIVSLYRGKGPRNQCFSYHPISFLSVPGKVFANVLPAQQEPLLTSHRRPHQSGFSGGRSTMNAIFALRLSAEIHHTFPQPLNMAYIDIKYAFNSVGQNTLWL